MHTWRGGREVSRIHQTTPHAQTGFAPQTRKEIRSIAWHWIDDLPAYGCAPLSSLATCTALDALCASARSSQEGGLKYFMVQPFVGPLRQVRVLSFLHAVPRLRLSPHAAATQWVASRKAGVPYVARQIRPAQPPPVGMLLLLPVCACVAADALRADVPVELPPPANEISAVPDLFPPFKLNIKSVMRSYDSYVG